jgi:hypothetical protein
MESRAVRAADAYGGQTSIGGRRIWGTDEYGGQTTKEGSQLRREDC